MAAASLLLASCGPVDEEQAVFADELDLGAALRACEVQGDECSTADPFTGTDIRTEDTPASVETLDALDITLWRGGTLGDSLVLVGYGVLGSRADPVMTFRVDSKSDGEFRYRSDGVWHTVRYKDGAFSASTAEAEERFDQVISRYHADNGCWDDALVKRNLRIVGQCLFCVGTIVLAGWIIGAVTAAVVAAGVPALAVIGISAAAATAFLTGAVAFAGSVVSSIAAWSTCGPCAYDGVIDPLWAYLDEKHEQALPKFTEGCIGETPPRKN